MKAVIIYKSKTGFARKYAEWISSVLDAELVNCRDFVNSDFNKYDVVIFGGGLYVGGINGVNIIKNNINLLKGKKVIVFASGATPKREETTKELFDFNFNAEEQKQIKFFYLRGGFDFSKLGIIDKILMTLLKLKLRMKKKSKRNADESGMLAAYAAPCDFTKLKYINELVEYAKA